MKRRFFWSQKVKLGLLLRSLILLITFWLTILSLHLAFNLIFQLPRNARSPVDGIFVLGGSISREIYAAKLAKQNPTLPILIARGSPDPCILAVFYRLQSPLDRVWLEVCSRSTFTNFMFGLPILDNWQVHKVKLITSGTHIRRSQWLARILLNSHGIWVDLDIAPEKGVPGNTEYWAKTGIDLTRAFAWAFLSQIVKPNCSDVYPLQEVNLAAWQNRKFSCERQGKLRN